MFDSVYVNSQKGMVALSQLGNLESVPATSNIYRINKNRVTEIDINIGKSTVGPVQAQIQKELDKRGISYFMITGDTNSKRRLEMCEEFNKDDSKEKVFLISLKAGGTGLNLTGADYVIHYDPWWNPAVEDQATDRAYRIGQTKKVFVYRLITKNTVEEKIQKIKGRKRDLVDSVVSIDRNITKSLTMEDIKDIFSVD